MADALLLELRNWSLAQKALVSKQTHGESAMLRK